MKTLKIIGLLFYISLSLQCQTQKNTHKMDTDFIINTQKVTYKDVELPLGKPLKEWVKIFGKYDRVLPPIEESNIIRRAYIWDKLGVMVAQHGEDKQDKFVSEFYIFFNNLDSPIGQEGKLKFAKGRETLEAIRKRNNYSKLYNNKDIIKQINDKLTIGPKAPKNYPYPFTIYEKSLNIEGIDIKKGMKVSQINDLRKEARLSFIKYWDTDMNSNEEQNSITTTSDGYFASLPPRLYNFDAEKPNNKYNILYWYTQQNLEYIRVVHDTGQDYTF